MSRYQHKKGQIKDNAIEALPHDPLSVSNALKKIRKAKEVICVKVNTVTRDGEASGKKVSDFLPLAAAGNGYFVLSCA